MNLKKWIPVLSLSLLLIVVVIAFFKCGEDKEFVPGPVLTSDSVALDEEDTRETDRIVLFYLSEEDYLLHPESRIIYRESTEVVQARRVIEELLKGPQNEAVSPFPPETKLRELFITPEGVAFVDFSREFQDLHPSGSAGEIATVFSIVNSLTYNLKSIKRVFILVNGGEQETLKGHIDLTRPLLPRYDLIVD